MIKNIEKFCKFNNLEFGITSAQTLTPKIYKSDVPFVNYTYEERTEPILTMDNCKSIIVVLMSYKVNTFEDKNKPKVSSPNLDYDYHGVLKNKLFELATDLDKLYSIEFKIFVDNGPLIDRELAVNAGLGYFSKNSNVINAKFGSSFFIGYIMLNKEIVYDTKKVNENCGNCTICVEACPTKAINNDYTINQYQCLSYLTQKKEELTDKEKTLLGNNLYGCSVCIKVCPKNKNNLYYEDNKLEFSDFMNNSNKEFERKYKNTGFYWRGNKVIKRNALIGYENSFK